MHENTEQIENKEVSRWMSHANHRLTYIHDRPQSFEQRYLKRTSISTFGWDGNNLNKDLIAYILVSNQYINNLVISLNFAFRFLLIRKSLKHRRTFSEHPKHSLSPPVSSLINENLFSLFF